MMNISSNLGTNCSGEWGAAFLLIVPHQPLSLEDCHLVTTLLCPQVQSPEVPGSFHFLRAPLSQGLTEFVNMKSSSLPRWGQTHKSLPCEAPPEISQPWVLPFPWPAPLTLLSVSSRAGLTKPLPLQSSSQSLLWVISHYLTGRLTGWGVIIGHIPWASTMRRALW